MEVSPVLGDILPVDLFVKKQLKMISILFSKEKNENILRPCG
jgi:hypothetical protein